MLVAATVDKVCAKHFVAVTDECVRAMPFVHAEILIEVVCDRVPWDELPAHSRLQAFDVLLWRSRREYQSGIARAEMSGMSDLVGQHRTADAGMLGPAMYAGFEQGAVDNQLTAAFEQVEQTRLTLGPVEPVFLFHRHPRHPPTLGGQRVTCAGHLLLLHKKLLSRSLPFVRQDHFRCFNVQCQCFCAHLCLSFLLVRRTTTTVLDTFFACRTRSAIILHNMSAFFAGGEKGVRAKGGEKGVRAKY